MHRLSWLAFATLIFVFGCAGNSKQISPSVETQPASVLVSEAISASSASDSSTAQNIEQSTAYNGTQIIGGENLSNSLVPAANKGLVSSGKRTDNYLSLAPATLSWRKAYERFYSGGITLTQSDIDVAWQARVPYGDYITNKNTDVVNLRSDSGIDFIYPLAKMSFADLGAVIDNGSTADMVLMYIEGSNRYGFLASYKNDGSFAGEGIVTVSNGSIAPHDSFFRGFYQGNYLYRTSMTITEGIEAQLLDFGFSPDTTHAFALAFTQDFYGVCFYDNEKAVYYNNSVAYGETLDKKIYSFEELSRRFCEIYAACSVTEIHADFENVPTVIPEPPVSNPTTAKPVIYLYPEQPTEVWVKLGYPKADLTYTYPAYNDGWHVLAQPDGRLTNLADNTEHYYLFWEGNKKVDWDFSQGFVVKGSQTEGFLREKLAYMGLTPREYNDFITYWVPKMLENPYNLISFSITQYEALAPLTITPEPDSILRVHMVYKRLEQPVPVAPQMLIPWQRKGFAAVEWGGSRG